jgi:prepilin-type N-terminal cleavage/methylation domain-containing protein/prepilin-type processing-associated H-X9-DG protein
VGNDLRNIQRTPGTRGAGDGFSLVELLVVIAVIAILAGILVPVLARARRSAQRQSCLSNVRQVGLAMRMYVDDYDGGFPIGAYLEGASPYTWNVSWHNELTQYLRDRNVLLCPLAPRRSGYRISYGCNARVSSWRSAALDAQVLDSSRTVYATEKEDEDWPAYPPSTRTEQYYKPLVPRHDGYLSVLFCDGHVRPLPVGQAEGANAVWQIELPAVDRASRAALKKAHVAGQASLKPHAPRRHNPHVEPDSSRSGSHPRRTVKSDLRLE